MTTEVHESIPANRLEDFLRELKENAETSRIEQRKNADGTFRITIFKGTAFDLFISYATEDFELCVSDFLKSLWRHGVTPVWIDRMSIDVGDSIPRKVDNGLLLSQYMLCILTDRYFNKFWTRVELDAIRMQKKQVIPVWVDTNFQAVNAFSPALAAKKAIIYDGDADHAMSVVARILLEDKSTIYFANKSERDEKEAFWGMVWLYIKSALGILEKRHDRGISKINPGVPWKKHIEKELGIDRHSIITIANTLVDLSSEEQSYLILAMLKRNSNGWFPTYDEELRVLRLKGISDW